MGITKHLKEVTKDFYVYGLHNDEWEIFDKGIEYDAFLAKRKRVTLHYEY